MTKAKVWYYVHVSKLIFYIVVPVVLWVLPATYFDSGDSVCLSVVLLDMECYGCGMTSACMHLIHGNFEMAYAYNALSFLVFPICAFLWGAEMLATFKIIRTAKTLSIQS